MTRRLTVLLALLLLSWSAEVAADEADAADQDASTTPRLRLTVASPLPDGFVPGSTYGWRSSPRTGRRTFHAGLDFLAPRGTDVRAVADGVVERVTRNTRGRTRFGGYGRAVVIHHPGRGVWTFYAHLDEVDVTVGQPLRAGERIGAVGNSTNHRFRAMASHLHFEVRHAAYGRRSPFPGPYRRFNLDPAAWLRSIGVRYGEPVDDTAVLEPGRLLQTPSSGPARDAADYFARTQTLRPRFSNSALPSRSSTGAT